MRIVLKYSLITVLGFFCLNSKAQGNEKPKVKLTLYDGYVMGGYVDGGAFLNFTGPNINMTMSDSKIVLGMLPSLRFKEDRAEVKNALVTPNLGVGITYSYKNFAVQVPFYYNAKTSTENGKWNIGVGIGYRFMK